MRGDGESGGPAPGGPRLGAPNGGAPRLAEPERTAVPDRDREPGGGGGGRVQNPAGTG